MGSKTSFTQFDKSSAGVIIGMDGNVPKFEIAKDSTSYISFDSSDALYIKTQKFELDAVGVEISSTNASMSLGEHPSGSKRIIFDGQAGGTDQDKSARITLFDGEASESIRLGEISVCDPTVGLTNPKYGMKFFKEA